MGSLVLTAFSLAILLFEMSSCKKATAQTNTVHDTVRVTVRDTFCPNTHPIQGLWIGTYTVDSIYNVPGVFDYSFSIYPNGTFITRGKLATGTFFASGTWNYTNNIITGTTVSIITPGINPVTQVFKGKNSSTGVLSGTYRDSINTNGTPLSYKFNMARVN